jgi:hypothetical protein
MEAVGSCRSSLRKRMSGQCVAFIAKLSLQELCIRLSPNIKGKENWTDNVVSSIGTFR